MRTELRPFRMAFPILKYLALNPSSNKLNISKATEIDRDTVHESLKILTKAKLVYVASKKNPIVMEYAVSPRGVIALLQAHPDHVKVTEADLAKLAEKHESFLPLVFGKWAYYPKTLAYPVLLDAVKKTADEVGLLKELSEGKQPDPGDLGFDRNEILHRHRIYEFMFHSSWAYGWFDDEKSRARWFWAIKSDDQLLKAATAEVDRVRLGAQETIQMLDDDLRRLQSDHINKKDEFPLVFPLEGEAGREIIGWLDFERALALDQGRPLPATSDLMRQIIELWTKREELRDQMLREGRGSKEIDNAVEKLSKEMRRKFYGRREKQRA